jgi:hypothetical protein
LRRGWRCCYRFGSSFFRRLCCCILFRYLPRNFSGDLLLRRSRATCRRIVFAASGSHQTKCEDYAKH